jgi:hypothetical protein
MNSMFYLNYENSVLCAWLLLVKSPTMCLYYMKYGLLFVFCRHLLKTRRLRVLFWYLLCTTLWLSLLNKWSWRTSLTTSSGLIGKRRNITRTPDAPVVSEQANGSQHDRGISTSYFNSSSVQLHFRASTCLFWLACTKSKLQVKDSICFREKTWDKGF